MWLLITVITVEYMQSFEKQRKQTNYSSCTRDYCLEKTFFEGTWRESHLGKQCLKDFSLPAIYFRSSAAYFNQRLLEPVPAVTG